MIFRKNYSEKCFFRREKTLDKNHSYDKKYIVVMIV
jgi:hypothetical protein